MGKIIGPDGRDHVWIDIESRPGIVAMSTKNRQRSEVRSVAGDGKNWVRVRVKKPKPVTNNPNGPYDRPYSHPLNPVLILPLRPVKPKPKPDTEYPSLPFLREHDLEARVITLLGTVPDYYSTPTFSPIPAIKHAKDVMGWDLWTSKEYVEKIYKKNLDKIEAARVISLKSWKAEHEDDAHV